MPKRNRSSDVNVVAVEIVQAATAESEPAKKVPRKKNPAAVALGRLGGLKGGKARAQKLSSRKRVEIAQKAARAPWKTT